MQPEFGIMREQQNKLFLQHYRNTRGKFHFHSQIELLFVDEGEVEVFVNERRRILKKDEMSVALSYDAHVYRSVGESCVTILYIPTYFCEDFITAVKSKRATNPFLCDGAVVRKLKEYLCEIEGAGEESNRIKTQGYIYLILGTLMEHIALEDAPGEIDPELSSRLLFYVNENFKNDITLASVSAAFGYHPSYISRYFKSCFHIGFNHYITTARLKNAILLMREKKYSITYCALESGFNSMRTFYRAFFSAFGASPGDYMKQMEETKRS